MERIAYEQQLVSLAKDSKYEELLTLSDKLVKDYPDWHIAWHYLAVAHGLKGDHEGAIEHFITALKCKPTSSKALYGLSVSCHALKMYDKAIACLLKYRTIVPPSFKDSFCLGINYAELDNNAEAIIYFTEAFHFDNNNEDLLFCLADSHRLVGNFEEAANYFKMSLAINPDNVNVLHNTAVVYANMNDKTTAISFYKQALLHNASFEPSLINLSELYLELGDTDAAKQLLARIEVNKS